MHDMGWYPAVAFTGNDEDEIHGEFVTIPIDKLIEFDAYEGYHEENVDNSLYIRVEKGFYGEPFFIYEYNGDLEGFPRIISGDWLHWRGETEGSNARLTHQLTSQVETVTEDG
jgi:gamma-glutamylcyclotransferase (GGCT)/AIG2-like uncharacterized protein YtfP